MSLLRWQQAAHIFSAGGRTSGIKGKPGPVS